MKLKAGRFRAVTLHERTPRGFDIADPDYSWSGVVWLCAVGFRKDGDADDAYTHFAGLGAAALRPVEVDYEDLFVEIRDEAAEALYFDLQVGMARLMREARSEPDVLHRLDIEPAAGIAMRVFSRHGYRVLVLPTIDSNRQPVSDEVLTLLIGAVFPGVRAQDLEAPDPRTVAGIVGYELRPGEFAYAFRYKAP